MSRLQDYKLYLLLEYHKIMYSYNKQLISAKMYNALALLAVA
jgi:hypothetical protein